MASRLARTIVVLLAFVGRIDRFLVNADDDTSTDTTKPGRPPNAGAARQIYGSSALRVHEWTTTQRSVPAVAAKSSADRQRTERPYSHGVIITEPHDSQLPNARTILNGGPQRQTGIVDLYGPRTFGERGGVRDGGHVIQHGHTNVLLSHDILMPDDTLMDPSMSGGEQADAVHEEEECRLGCLVTEFLCGRSCVCVPKYMRCDGENQCEDGDDEEECTVTNEDIVLGMKTECETDQRHVMCPRTFECIAKEWLCDGDDDCGDYSDETRCGKQTSCSTDQYECQNGLCIMGAWLCDGDNDCKDFSDELNCTRIACNPNEFQCSDGNCIAVAFKCDGDNDCADGTDELNCDLPMSNCPEGEFKCKATARGTSGHAGKCILNRFRCDGDNDCGDWSDEEACPAKMASCAATEFKCGDGVCIPGQWRCDHEQDCDSGEDEQNCDRLKRPAVLARSCSPDEFTCKDGRCIMNSWVCDGTADCRRAEDEVNCPSVCDVGQFSCPVDKNTSVIEICVQQKHICDGRKDCVNGEDELACGKATNCTSRSPCTHSCETFEGRERCTCRIGYVLDADKKSCVDIDECQFTHDPVCSQECTNTQGSFQCSCGAGYVMRPDLRTCKALGGAVKLIMANRADIREVSLSSNIYNSIVKGLHNVIALDYHHARQLIFWSDVSTDVIRMSFINGTRIRTIVKWGLEAPGGIAVDWIHDLLFWTDSGTRRIEVTTFDGKSRSLIAANDLDKPRAIAVHPGEALVFWTDWGNGLTATTGPAPKIERSYMDGSDRRVLIKDGIFWPNGLAIDYTSERIYWADAKHHVIESARFDGSERKKILSSGLPHPFALTIFEDLMIWTDWHTKKVSAANKITGRGFRNVHEGMSFPMDVHSYHPSRQPSFPNRCKLERTGLKGGCSHMCLPNRTGRRCACPIGLQLRDDQRTCTSIADKLLLIARKKDIRIRHLNTPQGSADMDMIVPLDGLKSTIAVEWCSDTDSIFWTDVGRSAISRANLDGSQQEHIITTNILSPAGLALDWATHKLYWTDPGTMRIEVSNMEGTRRALLIWQGLQKPRDIVVHPIDGLMFWSDWGDTPMIERAGMDGSSRAALVITNLKFPNGLAVDQKNSRLYFVDGGTKSLEYVGFDGTGRTKVIQSGLRHPFGIDVFGNSIYWTDWDTQTVEKADKTSGKNRRTLLNNTSDLMDIRVFHRDRGVVQNPCNANNGGCSHMCLLNPSGFSCACPIGVRSKNKRTCYDGPSKYIILAHRIDIRVISLDIDYSVDVILPFPGIANAVALDVDLQTGDVFWSDTIEDRIMRSSPDGSNNRPVVQDTINMVDGLTVDSVGRKLYWTDSGRCTIEVSELDGGSRTVLIWQELEAPRAIAVDYAVGLMFWTDWGSTPKIERAQMDGTRRTKIVTTPLVWPNGLSLDRRAKRVYWVDAQMKHVMSVDYDGNDRRTVAKDLPYPYGVAVSADQVFWTDWNTSSLNVLSRKTPLVHQEVLGGLQGLMDVKVIDKTIALPEDVCAANNGGCSHLCLRNARGFSCKCPTGTSLVKDSRFKCSKMPDEYLLVAMRLGIARISLDTPEYFDTVLPIPEVYGAVVLDYHYSLSKLFYADVYTDIIKVVDMMNMTDSRTIVSTGLATTNGIAVDWLANNLYWSDTVAKVIEVARLDGSCRKTIIGSNLTDPRSVIVYPKRGFIFWADWGQPARIERSFMDGSSRKAIVDTNNGFPTGLTIDFVTRKLFWTDALEDRIDSSDFDGRKRATIIPHAAHPFGISLAGNFIYWTDWFNKSVFRAPMKNAKLGTEIRNGLRGALDMRSVSRSRQPIDEHPCVRDNGGCSHLCLFRATSYVCACPDQSDGRCRSETQHTVIVPTDAEDYIDTFTGTAQPDENASDDTGHDSAKQRQIRIVIIATIVMTALFIIVVTAILILVCKSKPALGKGSPMGSTRSVLTFTNPNYNGADGAMAAGEHGPTAGAPKSTIWKRLKYDKAQERVYEEKCIEPESLAATRNLIAPTMPSPMPSPSVSMPLATISTK